MNLPVRTVVGTVLSRGFVYGGVNEVVSKTSEETSLAKYTLEPACCVKDKNDLPCSTGPGYCAHKNHDLCVIATCEIRYEASKESGMKDDSSEAVTESENTVSNDLHPTEKKSHLNADPHLGTTSKVTGTLLLTPIATPVTVCIAGRTVYRSETYSDGTKTVCLC